MNFYTKRKTSFLLTIIFVVSAALMFFLMGLTYKHMVKLTDYNTKMNESLEVSLKLEKLYTHLKDIENERRNYILTNDPSCIALVNTYETEINSNLKDLGKVFAQDSAQLKKLRSLENMIGEKYRIVEETFTNKFTRKTGEELKTSLLSGRSVMEKIGNLIDQMLTNESKVLELHKNNLLFAEKSLPIYIYICAIVTLGLIGFAFFAINTEVRKQRGINNDLQLALDTTNLAEKIGNYGVWIYDFATGKYSFSDNEYRILDYEPQSFEPSKGVFIQHSHPDDVARAEKEFAKKNTQQSIEPFTFRTITHTGKEKFLMFTAKKIPRENNSKVLLGITMDVTNEVMAKRKMEESNKTLEATNKELESFNYIASHDLQEPLRKIETFISRLEDREFDRLSDTGKQYFERMSIATGRMRKLIEDLLQFSRTSRNDQNFERTDLNTLLEMVIEELQQEIEEKNAIIDFEHLPTAEVIPFQIRQLFNNLITNSLKYSKDGIRPEITVSVKEFIGKPTEKSFDDKYFELTFKDNGIGFEQEYSDKIFELFARLHAKNHYEGTGIGLAICKKIIDNHKGVILAKSAPNKGSTFTIYLPKKHFVQ